MKRTRDGVQASPDIAAYPPHGIHGRILSSPEDKVSNFSPYLRAISMRGEPHKIVRLYRLKIETRFAISADWREK
uniref:Uncharacterized protein n=1 Tax=Rhizophora mucronata TaxID=61149 RepID=A0A2P2P6L9_RHIMU